MLLAYLKTVRSSNKLPRHQRQGACVCALGQLTRNAAQCDRVGFRNTQPQLAEAAEKLEAEVDSTEKCGRAALILLLWKPDCSH